jgi:hypothetical protein
MALSVAMDGAEPVGYVALDLSAGGALLTGGPALPIGREARVLLPMLGRDLVLRGRVMRSATDAGGQPCIGVCFRGVPTFVQDLIQNQVLLARERGGARPAEEREEPAPGR